MEQNEHETIYYIPSYYIPYVRIYTQVMNWYQHDQYTYVPCQITLVIYY